jgi:protein O-mannosyl-transferase
MDRRKHVKKPVQPVAPASPKKAVAPSVNPLHGDVYYRWLGLVVAFIAFLVYAQTIGYGFALDDYSVILENKDTQKGIGAIGYFFKTSLRHGYIFISDELYRPLTKSVYALGWTISPESPLPGHVINVLLYALTCGILFRVISTWTGSVMTGFTTSALFAVLPVHTEAVANIKSVDEILGLLFGILSLHSFYKYSFTQKTSTLIAAICWLLLALFSKESSVTLLAVIPLVLYFFTPARGSILWKPAAYAAVVIFVFLMIRQSVLGPAGDIGAPSAADNMLVHAKGIGKVTTAIYILGRYLWVIVAGFPLSFDHSWPSFPVVNAGDWQFLVAGLVLTGLFIFAIMRFKKRDPLSFALLFFFITVSISSNLFITIGTHWGERLMFMPSLGICMAFAVLLDRYTKPSHDFSKRMIPIAFTTVLILVFGGMSIARNPVWKNNGSLYHSGLISAPNSARVHYYMGNWLGKEEQYAGFSTEDKNKMLDSAITYLQTSVKLYRPFADAWNQMGVCNYKLKKYKEAYDAYIEGLKYNPNDPTIHNNLGTIYFETGRYEDALKAFLKATELKKDYAEAWGNLGSVYGTMKRYNDAINAFNQSVTADPNYATGWYYLGLTWRFAGDETKAQQNIARAQSINPNIGK